MSRAWIAAPLLLTGCITASSHLRSPDETKPAPAAKASALEAYRNCLAALEQAAALPMSQRAACANRCVHALAHVQDPDSYFVSDPAGRPADPPWTNYWHRLERLLEAVAGEVEASTVESLRRRQEELRARIERDGLEPPRVEAMLAHLQPGEGAPYDRMPWLIVEGGLAIVGAARYTLYDHELRTRFELAMRGEDERRLALLVVDGTSAEPVARARALATSMHLSAVELVLAKTGADGRRRPVLLELELPGGGRDRWRRPESRPPSLTLIARPEGVEVRSGDGGFTVTGARLATRLAELRRAFPDDAGVRLAVDPSVDYAAFVELARQARRHFQRLILVDIPRARH